MEVSQSLIRQYTTPVGVDGLLPLGLPQQSQGNSSPVDSVSLTCQADPDNVKMELLRKQARQQPKLNFAQRALIGTGDTLGRGFRNLSSAVGGEVRKSFENPLRLAPGVGQSYQMAEQMGVELPKPPTLPGSKMIGAGAESVVRGMGEFGASTAEDGAQALAHPVQTADGLIRLSKALQTDSPMGVANVMAESIATGKSYLEVRREHRKPIDDAINGVAQDFQKNREEIGLPGAATKLGLDVFGLPKTAALSAPKVVRLSNAAGGVVQGQTRRLSMTPQFKELPAEQQATLTNVVDQGAPKIAGVKIPFYAGKAEQSVSKLVGEGRLQSDPALYGEVSKLQEATTGPGISKTTLVRDTLESVAKPGVIKQGCKGTCAATTPQFDMAEKQPADFVRTARALMSKEGEIELANKTVLSRNETGVGFDFSGRRQLDRVMQSSFMDHGSKYTPGSRYHNGKDAHIMSDGSKSHSGLSGAESLRIRQDILGENVLTKSFPAEKTGPARAAAEKEFLEDLSLAQTEGKNLQVSLSWGEGDSGHALSVSRVEDGYVYGRNPWGSGDVGQGGLKREMLDNEGRFRAKTDDFFDQLYSYHTPVPGFEVFR